MAAIALLMRKSMLFRLVVLLALMLYSCNNSPESGSREIPFRELSGPFLGQSMPDSVPGLFAPGVVSTGMFTRDVAISPDGKELYFCVAIGNYTYSTILFTKEVNGKWLPPEIVPFSGGPGVMDFEPALSADGGEFFPSLTLDGTLYFTRNEKGSSLNQVMRTQWVDGSFQEPELLPEQVNCGTNRFNAFVAQDESYMIVPAEGMPDAYDGVDYYIVFCFNYS